MYAIGVLEVEQGSLTPMVFTTTERMAGECKRYHSRLAELLSTKKGEDYSTTSQDWPSAVIARVLNKNAV